jgi:serine/threonine-protein kinase
VLAIAPDGSRVAFVEGLSGKSSLYVRELDDAELRRLEGAEGASSPFFSPDGHWVAFFAPGKLRKIAVDGGRPIDLAVASLDRGGVWCPDGSIVFAATATSGLLRLPAAGGTPDQLTQLDVARGERTHRWPAVLPGGREVAFTVGLVGQPGDYDDAQIDAVDLVTGKRRPLLRGASMVRFTPGGAALLGRQGQVLSLPLAGLHGQRVDEARPVLRNVAGVPASGIVHFDLAHDGTLVYAEGDPHSTKLELAWLSRDGEAEPLTLPRGQYRTPLFAPDGRRVAMVIGPGGGRGGDISVLDLASGALTRLTFESRSASPIWTADGTNVTFAVVLPSGDDELRQRPADGSREAVVVRRFAGGRARAPVAWMPDGSLLFAEEAGAGSAGNILYLPPGGGEPRPFASTPAIEIEPVVSPDRRYVAYAADATGEQQVYVQPFPPNGAKWLVADPASTPRWSADGRELYFVAGRSLMAVPVSTAGSFSAGTPHQLFELPPSFVLTEDTATNFDVAPDGRFLGVRTTSTEPTGGHLVVVLGWFAKLEELMRERSR